MLKEDDPTEPSNLTGKDFVKQAIWLSDIHLEFLSFHEVHKRGRWESAGQSRHGVGGESPLQSRE